MSDTITVTVTFPRRVGVLDTDYVAFVQEAVEQWGYCTNGIATKGAKEEPSDGPLWGLGDKAQVELVKKVPASGRVKIYFGE